MGLTSMEGQEGRVQCVWGGDWVGAWCGGTEGVQVKRKRYGGKGGRTTLQSLDCTLQMFTSAS